jgi:hypothetical protein
LRIVAGKEGRKNAKILKNFLLTQMAHPLEPTQIVSLLTSAPLKKTICQFAGSKINISKNLGN